MNDVVLSSRNKRFINFLESLGIILLAHVETHILAVFEVTRHQMGVLLSGSLLECTDPLLSRDGSSPTESCLNVKVLDLLADIYFAS